MKGFKKILTVLFAFLLVVASLCACANNTENPDNKLPVTPDEGKEDTMKNYWENTVDFGIGVDKDGTMTLGGEKLYLAGVNCYNLFNQCFGTYDAALAKTTLQTLKEYGVKVIRFNCGGYGYDYITDFYLNQTKYVALLSRVVDLAEEAQIGLIPSFFWLDHAVPDYFDEPIRAWGNPNSKTVKFLKEYTQIVVNTLKDRKAIFGWELGNEYNLACDLPNASDLMPALPPHSKRESRTEEDYLSATDVAYAMRVFTQTVRGLDDTGRMITSGNASLRPSQYHQLHEKSWQQDTREQYAQMTAMYAPDGADVISEHVYFTEQRTFDELLTLDQYLAEITAMAKQLKKGYFVGEWGGGNAGDISYYKGIADSMVNADVQLILLWNYNLTEGSIEYSFSAETERGRELLNLVQYMNGRYESEKK